MTFFFKKSNQTKPNIFFTMAWSINDERIQSALPDAVTLPMVAGSLAVIVAANVFMRSRSFKRDGSASFSDIVTGSVSILSNKDSVLQRDQVGKSMGEYDALFKGARKEVGSIHTEESIKKRENNFYDLVTDFYEFGWGQVRAFKCHWRRKVCCGYGAPTRYKNGRLFLFQRIIFVNKGRVLLLLLLSSSFTGGIIQMSV